MYLKLVPSATGLLRSVWLNDPDPPSAVPMQVRVNRVPGMLGEWPWPKSLFVSVEPCAEIVAPGDVAVLTEEISTICSWVQLNLTTITEFWNGTITPAQALGQLQPIG